MSCEINLELEHKKYELESEVYNSALNIIGNEAYNQLIENQSPKIKLSEIKENLIKNITKRSKMIIRNSKPEEKQELEELYSDRVVKEVLEKALSHVESSIKVLGINLNENKKLTTDENEKILEEELEVNEKERSFHNSDGHFAINPVKMLNQTMAYIMLGHKTRPNKKSRNYSGTNYANYNDLFSVVMQILGQQSLSFNDQLSKLKNYIQYYPDLSGLVKRLENLPDRYKAMFSTAMNLSKVGVYNISKGNKSFDETSYKRYEGVINFMIKNFAENDNFVTENNRFNVLDSKRYKSETNYILFYENKLKANSSKVKENDTVAKYSFNTFLDNEIIPFEDAKEIFGLKKHLEGYQTRSITINNRFYNVRLNENGEYVLNMLPTKFNPETVKQDLVIVVQKILKDIGIDLPLHYSRKLVDDLIGKSKNSIDNANIIKLIKDIKILITLINHGRNEDIINNINLDRDKIEHILESLSLVIPNQKSNSIISNRKSLYLINIPTPYQSNYDNIHTDQKFLKERKLAHISYESDYFKAIEENEEFVSSKSFSITSLGFNLFNNKPYHQLTKEEIEKINRLSFLDSLDINSNPVIAADVDLANRLNPFSTIDQSTIKTANYITTTMADSGRVRVVNGLYYNLHSDSKVELTEEELEVEAIENGSKLLLQKVVLNELKRIYEIHKMKKPDSSFNAGKFFLMMPLLNKFNINKYITESKNFDAELKELKNSPTSLVSKTKLGKELMPLIQEHILNKVNKNALSKSMFNSIKRHTYTNNNFVKNSRIFEVSYTVNNQIFRMFEAQGILNDAASFGKKFGPYTDISILNDEQYAKILPSLSRDIDELKKNYNKRIKQFNSPVITYPEMDFLQEGDFKNKIIKEHYNFKELPVKVGLSSSLNLNYLEELYGKDSKEYKAYLKIDRADAQGYITMSQWASEAFMHGKIDQSTVEKIYELDEQGSDVTQEILDLIQENSFQVKKPKYSETKIIDGFHHNVFVKNSEIVLVPNFTKSFPKLEGMRKAMVSNKIHKVQDSAGAIKTDYISLNNNLDLSNDNLGEEETIKLINKAAKSNQQLVRERSLKNTGVQVSTPSHINEHKVTITKQPEKDRMSYFAGLESIDLSSVPQIQNIAKILGLKLENNKISGKDFVDLFHKIRITMNNSSIIQEHIINEIFENESYGKDLDLHESLIENLKLQKSNYSKIRMLDLNTDGNFIVDLSLNPNNTELQNMIASEFNKRYAPFKTEGSTLVLASNFGLNDEVKFGLPTAKITEEEVENSLLKTTFAPNYQGKLWPGGKYWVNKETGERFIKKPKESEIDNYEYKQMPGQVIIPNKFFYQGQQIDLTEYVVQKEIIRNGKKEYIQVLDENKMSLDVLNITGARVPTTGSNSFDSFEVVGILPSGSSQIMITHDDVIIQMGSDFDVDKIYAAFSKVYYNSKKDKIEKIGYGLSLDNRIEILLSRFNLNNKFKLKEKFKEINDVLSYISLLDNKPLQYKLYQDLELKFRNFVNNSLIDENGDKISARFIKLDTKASIKKAEFIGKISEEIENLIEFLSNKTKELDDSFDEKEKKKIQQIHITKLTYEKNQISNLLEIYNELELLFKKEIKNTIKLLDEINNSKDFFLLEEVQQMHTDFNYAMNIIDHEGYQKTKKNPTSFNGYEEINEAVIESMASDELFETGIGDPDFSIENFENGKESKTMTGISAASLSFYNLLRQSDKSISIESFFTPFKLYKDSKKKILSDKGNTNIQLVSQETFEEFKKSNMAWVNIFTDMANNSELANLGANSDNYSLMLNLLLQGYSQAETIYIINNPILKEFNKKVNEKKMLEGNSMTLNQIKKEVYNDILLQIYKKAQELYPNVKLDYVAENLSEQEFFKRNLNETSNDKYKNLTASLKDLRKDSIENLATSKLILDYFVDNENGVKAITDISNLANIDSYDKAPKHIGEYELLFNYITSIVKEDQINKNQKKTGPYVDITRKKLQHIKGLFGDISEKKEEGYVAIPNSPYYMKPTKYIGSVLVDSYATSYKKMLEKFKMQNVLKETRIALMNELKINGFSSFSKQDVKKINNALNVMLFSHPRTGLLEGESMYDLHTRLFFYGKSDKGTLMEQLTKIQKLPFMQNNSFIQSFSTSDKADSNIMEMPIFNSKISEGHLGQGVKLYNDAMAFYEMIYDAHISGSGNTLIPGIDLLEFYKDLVKSLLTTNAYEGNTNFIDLIHPAFMEDMEILENLSPENESFSIIINDIKNNTHSILDNDSSLGNSYNNRTIETASFDVNDDINSQIQVLDNLVNDVYGIDNVSDDINFIKTDLMIPITSNNELVETKMIENLVYVRNKEGKYVLFRKLLSDTDRFMNNVHNKYAFYNFDQNEDHIYDLITKEVTYTRTALQKEKTKKQKAQEQKDNGKEMSSSKSFAEVMKTGFFSGEVSSDTNTDADNKKNKDQALQSFSNNTYNYDVNYSIEKESDNYCKG